MAQLLLTGGSNYTRSLIANAQVCVNVFPEKNSPDAPVPFTHYERPGLRRRSRPLQAGPGRGLWWGSNGNLYGVVGSKVYYIDQNWQWTLLGSLLVAGASPVSMADNGTQLVLVDGSTHGYTIELNNNQFAEWVEETGSFQGANKIAYLDTFMIWNVPGTKFFRSTLSNTLLCDPLYIAGKVGYPDPLVTLSVNRREITLLGKFKSEQWYDAGLAAFPFAEIPGVFLEHGTVALNSVATTDISTYWLGQDRQGQGVVFRLRGYEVKRVSNHSLEVALRRMASRTVLSDATAYCYQQDGHVFYVLSFPSGDQTWVLDESTDEWHQRGWTDGNGRLHRERPGAYAYAYGQQAVLDWETGDLYTLDLDLYQDEVGEAPFTPFVRRRTFPHVTWAVNEQGQQVIGDGDRLQFTSFTADMEVGEAAKDPSGREAQVALRYSRDRGKTWSSALLQSLGSPGEWMTQPNWGGGQGIARDMVFELSWSVFGPAALNRAWITVEKLEG